MNTIRVYSKNADYQKFEVLKTNRNKRYRYGEFFVEGVRNINGAVKNGWRIASFLYPGGDALSRWARELLAATPTEVNYRLSPALMEELSGKEEPSELLAIVKMRDDGDALNGLSLSANPVLALFDRPSNKGNLGTVIRSCDAMGVEALLLTGHAVDPYDPEVTAASMGSFFKVPVIRVADNAAVLSFIGKMRESYPGFAAIGTTAHRETPIGAADLRSPVLLMLGNETDGLCRALRDCCDVLATIPMDPRASASSLNVGCAATVLFYEAVRQRAEKRKE